MTIIGAPSRRSKKFCLRRSKKNRRASPACLAGQADAISNLPIEEIERVEKNPRTRVEKVQGYRMYFLTMNVTHKPFDNKLVRQAFNYSVDPTVILKHIFEGNGYALNGPLSSNMIGYDPAIKRYPFDPKKARELLAKAGYPNGLEVKLYLAPDRHLKGKEVCQVIARQLAESGIKAELVPQEYPIYWGRDGVNGGKLPFYYAGRSAYDADTFYDQYFHTGVTKRTGYSNPELDKLIEEEQQTGDHKKRDRRPAAGRAHRDGRCSGRAALHARGNLRPGAKYYLARQSEQRNHRRRYEDQVGKQTGPRIAATRLLGEKLAQRVAVRSRIDAVSGEVPAKGAQGPKRGIAVGRLAARCGEPKKERSRDAILIDQRQTRAEKGQLALPTIEVTAFWICQARYDNLRQLLRALEKNSFSGCVERLHQRDSHARLIDEQSGRSWPFVKAVIHPLLAAAAAIPKKLKHTQRLRFKLRTIQNPGGVQIRDDRRCIGVAVDAFVDDGKELVGPRAPRRGARNLHSQRMPAWKGRRVFCPDNR